MSSVFTAAKIITGYTALGYSVKARSDAMCDIQDFYLYIHTHTNIYINFPLFSLSL